MADNIGSRPSGGKEADPRAIGVRPGGSVAQDGNNVPLHKRLAQGYTPSTSGAKTPA